ncbi:tetratricopeptide repeat protein [Hymenobacter sp. ASUV-10]|uniref:Tetratricopeptide repeat protein n=1 Tax=Hymenobacter aranciens TaxID=3063996 RepID=A0ABT9B4H1_9BACT|nr:tetratricopeptide repeat protein [Hymenobacter sp. ASUV-10]MDO7873150.1 tetratricopeptide repeat protein [Hymenobacter sp. ASUV-10]
MSKIPFTGKSQQARQGQQTTQTVVSTDPLAPAENLSYENPLLEDPDALAERLAQSEDFVRNNRNVLLGILAVVVLAVVGGFGYYTWRNNQDTQAQAQMFKAVNYWESDSLKQAMKGDGKAPGLATVANEYGGTKAGNLANFYAGVAALKQGQFKEALDNLEDFSSDDYLVQSRAYSLMGDAQMELNNPKEAADLYAKAADHNANEQFSPGYLLKEAGAREIAKDNEGALKAYNRIITEYPTAQEVGEARQFKARLDK